MKPKAEQKIYIKVGKTGYKEARIVSKIQKTLAEILKVNPKFEFEPARDKEDLRLLYDRLRYHQRKYSKNKPEPHYLPQPTQKEVILESKSSVKTIEQWLKTLPSPYKELALIEAKAYEEGEAHPTLKEHRRFLFSAIAGAFRWQSSELGIDFWRSVYHSAKQALEDNKKLTKEYIGNHLIADGVSQEKKTKEMLFPEQPINSDPTEPIKEPTLKETLEDSIKNKPSLLSRFINWLIVIFGWLALVIGSDKAVRQSYKLMIKRAKDAEKQRKKMNRPENRPDLYRKVIKKGLIWDSVEYHERERPLIEEELQQSRKKQNYQNLKP